MTMSKYASREDHAEAMGYDCGKNGANETNCHFGIFSEKRFTQAWERGKAKADAERSHQPQSSPSKD